MIYEFYHIQCLLVAFSFLVCGLMFIFIDIPDNPLLGNYRRARYMMAAACLFFAGVSMTEYLFADAANSDVPLMQTVTLVIAVSQAVLFTMALLALLDAGFSGKRYLFIEALLLIIATFAVYAVCSEAVFAVVFYVFSGIYALLLVRYTRLFMAGYRQFRLRMDNYFSDCEAGRMRWVAFSFFAALGIGIIALLTAVFPSTLVLVLFTVVYGVFYIWFTIRFINYAHRFHIIEHALENEPTDKTIPPQTNELLADNPEISQTVDTSLFDKLEHQLERWVADKRFTEKGVTIDALAQEFCTNRSYLSTYINTCKGKTFREWMNELKMEEAKKLMCQYPDMSLKEIARQSGFSDRSHFTRQFTRLTGIAPNLWKKRQFQVS
jgi:AraC-like DNA-binding protein